MSTDSINYLTKLKRKYLLLRSCEVFLLSLGAACLAFGLTTYLNFGLASRVMTSTSLGIVITSAFMLRWKLHNFDKNRLVVFINREYPVMQYSTDLLFKDPGTLTLLEQIQKEKVRPHFEEIARAIKLPHNIEKSFIISATCTALMALLFFLAPQAAFDPIKKIENLSTKTGSATPLPPTVQEVSVSITPPLYTGAEAYTSPVLNLSMPEGSSVTWEIQFTDTVRKPALVFLSKDSLKLVPTRKKYKGKRSFQESNIYQLSWWTEKGQLRTSDYYQAEVTPDQPPRISVQQQPEYTEVRLDEKQSVPLKVNFSDDYGLEDAYIVATVSKGSGESIKFREERLPFTTPSRIRGRNAQGLRTIDLKALGLEPGDELYYYVEATDNKPLPNRARTQTYFISLPDTSSHTLSVEAGLGVDLMPAYFRSQRQIIIDSEKLLKERKAISKEEFNSRSNEIGYDQKVLRLKYGEFLGEEFETNIVPGAESAEHEGAEKHDHEEEEHNEGEDDPTEAYKHIHDDPEEATFFTQSIRLKLKAALSAMWDAELHLRTFDPGKSLPFQYVALRLLKDISQDSRIYVHKTGFDPPPLKEEKRLAGDLSEIKNSAYNRRVKDAESYPAIRSALGIIEEWLSRPEKPLDINAQQTLLGAGQELAVIALDEPGNYLHALSVIQSLTEDEVPLQDVRENITVLRKVFWKVLPKEMAKPGKTTGSLLELDRAFIDHLKPMAK